MYLSAAPRSFRILARAFLLSSCFSSGKELLGGECISSFPQKTGAARARCSQATDYQAPLDEEAARAIECYPSSEDEDVSAEIEGANRSLFAIQEDPAELPDADIGVPRNIGVLFRPQLAASPHKYLAL
jgi:hypothetical protein